VEEQAVLKARFVRPCRPVGLRHLCRVCVQESHTKKGRGGEGREERRWGGEGMSTGTHAHKCSLTGTPAGSRCPTQAHTDTQTHTSAPHPTALLYPRTSLVMAARSSPSLAPRALPRSEPPALERSRARRSCSAASVVATAIFRVSSACVCKCGRGRKYAHTHARMHARTRVKAKMVISHAHESHQRTQGYSHDTITAAATGGASISRRTARPTTSESLLPVRTCSASV